MNNVIIVFLSFSFFLSPLVGGIVIIPNYMYNDGYKVVS